MVGAHGLDSDGKIHAPRYFHAGPLRPRPCQRQIHGLDHEISLRSDYRAWLDIARHWRMAIRDVGNFRANRCGPPCDLAGEFGDALVGHTALPDSRPFDEQLVGGDTDGWRRPAQQSPRASSVRPTRDEVVRN